jgi:hypothetical protein
MNKVRRDSRWRLDAVHRVGAVLFGLGLWVFGILGIVDRLKPFSTSGESVLGLSSNGLLSAISLIVGGVLIAAALRGGRTASTVTVVVGAAFVLSGLVNVLVLNTPLNLLAFRMPNVIFTTAGSPVGFPRTTPTRRNVTAAATWRFRFRPCSGTRPTWSPHGSSPRPSAPSPSTPLLASRWCASPLPAGRGGPRTGSASGGRAPADPSG